MTPADLDAAARGVIAVGFAGTTRADAPLAALRAFAPGAVLLFARNVGTTGELRELIGALRAVGAPPPLIAVDQEGGRVERITDGVARLPSAMAVGAAGDDALAEGLGRLLGRDLARLGVTVDLAPVADLALRPESVVIGTRAFGDDPGRVAGCACAFARGLERGGVAAALKHFPGHGATGDDSHASLPRIATDEATLRARDLVPFARAIAARSASLVLSAHVVVEAFDAVRPATRSRAILTGVLRDELGFEGVIATDCLEMSAIADTVGTVRGAVDALAAGADLLLISHRLELAQAAADAIAAAVRDGRIPRARLAEAHARVLALRERMAQPRPSDEPIADDAPFEAARRAVTAVRGDVRLRVDPITVLSFEGAAADSVARSGAAGEAAGGASLSAALRRRGRKSENMRVPLDPEPGDVDLLLELVCALGEREFVALVRNAHRHPRQRAAVARLLDAVPATLVVSAGAPFDAALWPNAQRVACIYGDTPVSIEGCADVLSGRVPAAGTLPVRLAHDAAVR